MHMIYANRSTIWQLLIQMDNKFWTMQNKTTTDTRKHYNEVLNRLKNIFRFFCVMLSTWIVTTLRLSELPIKCYVPGWVTLRLLIILQDLLCIITPVSLLCTDMLFITIVTLLSLQARMLNENFEGIFEAQNYDKMVREELKEWIEHHCFILKYVSSVNKAFSKGMLAYLGNVVGVLCTYIYFLSISDTSNIVSVIPVINVILVGYLEFVYCYCVPAQNLMDEVEKINRTVYLANWEQHLEHSNSVMLITIRSQKGIALTAGGFGKLSLETCMRVLNTVVSYYMFLKTVIDG